MTLIGAVNKFDYKIIKICMYKIFTVFNIFDRPAMHHLWFGSFIEGRRMFIILVLCTI